MPLKRKAVWFCCPREDPSYKPTVSVEVEVRKVNSGDPASDIVRGGNITDTEVWCFGFKLTELEAKKLKFCPACGAVIPTPEAITTLEGLTDNEG